MRVKRTIVISAIVALSSAGSITAGVVTAAQAGTNVVATVHAGNYYHG